jgi:pimeloyl-ACP methyl ester carboxylesterase
VRAAVEALRERTAKGSPPAAILSHSAGGWLARVYLQDFGTEGFDRLVSLGSPHRPPPEGVLDQTRGILTFCESSCPGAFHGEVRFVLRNCTAQQPKVAMKAEGCHVTLAPFALMWST